jgi:hypothetical protein
MGEVKWLQILHFKYKHHSYTVTVQSVLTSMKRSICWRPSLMLCQHKKKYENVDILFIVRSWNSHSPSTLSHKIEKLNNLKFYESKKTKELKT